MIAQSSKDAGPAFQRATRTVVVVDLVESVRLIERNENDVIGRWRHFVEEVVTQVLPAHNGRLVKSLGDGMLLEFAQVPSAIQAAFAMQVAVMRYNEERSPENWLQLRIGAHTAELIVDDLDVYGKGVNLAERLTTLAQPGEIIVSAEVRDQLTPILDGDVEDLGDCYLKHVERPVRAFRVGLPITRPIKQRDTIVLHELRPTLAVIPFVLRSGEPEDDVLGEVLADEVISTLSRTSELQLISRLSTTGLRGRGISLTELGDLLNTNYVLSGRYRVSDFRLSLTAELAETKSGHLLWNINLIGEILSIVSGEDELIDILVAEVSQAVIARELQRAQSLALPTLESHTLLMGAIALMHRTAARDFDRAREMLEVLTERVPRQAIPHAWLAKWHVLRVNRGWWSDQENEARPALRSAKRALDADPDCSLALTIDGFVHTNLLKRLDIGLKRYEQALKINPNESLAWLLKGTLHAFKDEGEQAIADTEQSLRLSPLDPLKHFYESLTATAALSARQFERALALAQSSLRANRNHTSTLRALAIAQSQLGRLDEARDTVAELMRLDPTFTIRDFQQRSPSSDYAIGKMAAEALRRAGVPE